MSATLRHDVGLSTARVLTLADAVLMENFGMSGARRWQGVCRARRDVATFSVKLPDQRAGAWRLIDVCGRFARDTSADAWKVNSGLKTLGRKLRVGLGLPVPELGDAVTDDEAGLIEKIDESLGGDLSLWAVYADWLQDRGSFRGDVVRGWLDPKVPVKVKYGLPEAARDGYGYSKIMNLAKA